MVWGLGHRVAYIAEPDHGVVANSGGQRRVMWRVGMHWARVGALRNLERLRVRSRATAGDVTPTKFEWGKGEAQVQIVDVAFIRLLVR
jgi:hypothetical protein